MPPTAAPPSPEAATRARQAYARGQAAFAQADFAVAEAAFEEAFANVPNPIVLVSIAESAAKQGRLETAIAAYDKYLQLRPDAPDRAEVDEKRASLAQTSAQLSLTSEPAGADVLIDGRVTGRQTPATLEVSPGAHTIELKLSGYTAEPLPLQVAPGARLEHTFTLKTEVAEATSQEAAPAAPAAAAQAATPPAPPTAAIVVTASLGAAGLIAGTTLGILALSARSDFQSNPTEAKADNGERLALFSDVGFGIGVMALITTAVLVLTHDTTEAADKQPQAAHLQIIPTVTPGGASATAKLRF